MTDLTPATAAPIPREVIEKWLAWAERKAAENSDEFVRLSREGLIDNPAWQQRFTAVKTHGWQLAGRVEMLRWVLSEEVPDA